MWANRQLLNTDNWTRTSTQLLEDRVIRDQLAIYLVDQMYASVDVPGELGEALPEPLQRSPLRLRAGCVSWPSRPRVRRSPDLAPRPCGQTPTARRSWRC